MTKTIIPAFFVAPVSFFFLYVWYNNTMRLEHESEEKIKNEILRIMGKHLDLNAYKVFLFGSRVNGKGDERSDIDVGIEGSKEVPLAAMALIEEEIENSPFLYKIEVVDFKKVSPDFYNVAKQRIEPIN